MAAFIIYIPLIWLMLHLLLVDYGQIKFRSNMRYRLLYSQLQLRFHAVLFKIYCFSKDAV